jgi:hypothetical protein
MTRLLKAFGIAMSAIAMFAVMASAAHAETGELTATEYPAFITGEQVGPVVFDIGAGPARTVECAISRMDSTITGPTDPVTFKPSYAGCISFPGGVPATVTVNNCDYGFGVSKPNTTGIALPTTGRLHASLNCPVGPPLEIHVYENAAKHMENVTTCRYDIGAQGPVLAGIYHNVEMAAPPDILATVNATFNAFNTQGPMGTCGAMAFQNIPITLTGRYTLRGFKDNEGVEEGQIPIDIA